MNLLKAVFLTIILTITTLNLPVVSYNLMHKDGKFVLVLGDVHIQALDQINTVNMQTIIKVINQSNSNVDCIAEIPEDYLNNRDSGDLAVTFSILLDTLDNKNIKLIAFEPRDIQSEIIHSYTDEIYKYIFTNESFNIQEFSKHILSGYTTSPIYKKAPIKNYYQHLEKNIITIQEWLSNYDPSSAEFNIMNQKFEYYKTGIIKARKLFSKYSENDDLVISLINMFKNNNKDQALTLVSEILNILITNLDFAFVDIGFLHTILQSQSNKNKTMFIAGETHCEEVSLILTKIGYESMLKKTITAGEGMNFRIETSRSGLNQFLADSVNITSIFLAQNTSEKLNQGDFQQVQGLMQQLVIKDDSSSSSAPTCCNCKKPASDIIKLSRCSKCKSVSYCGRECQIADWKKHKPNCCS